MQGGWGEEAREVPPACLCRQETLEGTGKGNRRPEGWEVSGVSVQDLSTTDFKILILLPSKVWRWRFLELSGDLHRRTEGLGDVLMCGFRSPATRTQVGSVDLRFPGYCCAQPLGCLDSLVCVPGKALIFPHLSRWCHPGSPPLWGARV